MPSPPVGAQNLRPALSEDAGPLPPRRPRTPPGLRPTAPPPVTEETPLVQSRARRLGVEAPSPRADDAPLGPVDENAEPDPDTLPPTGMRPAVRDGDPDSGVEPEPVLDGVQAEEEPYRNPDGADPVQWDSRNLEDADAFQRPPAGHDAQAFGVEFEPLADRRPLTLFRFEPWQPRGVRVGNFTLLSTVDLGAAWLSNLFRSKPARSDIAAEIRPTLRLVSNWRVHALELRATGGFTTFNEYPKEGDRAYSLEARGRLDVTKRTSVSASALRDVAQETRGTLESRLRGGQRADVTSDEGRLQLDHRFNRVAVQLRGSIQQRTFEDVAQAGGGAGVSNRDRNRTTTEEAARVSYSFKPSFLGFVESALNQRRFEAAAADGIRRDSDGERYRVGIGFGTTSQVLRGEASVGYGRQTPVDSRLKAVDGIIVDANLTWRVNALTAMLLRGSTDVVETTTAHSGGGINRRVEAQIRHAFLRPLIGTASIAHSATSYEGVPLTESATEMGLGVEYYLGPHAVLYGRYQHSMLRTTARAAEWDADEVRVGLRLRQ